MSEMDDIFDMRALVKKHGDRGEKQAWKNLENWIWNMQKEIDGHRACHASVFKLCDALVAIAPDAVKIAQKNAKARGE